MATTDRDERTAGAGGWRERYDATPEREGELFSTISGIENEPLYGPENVEIDYEGDNLSLTAVGLKHAPRQIDRGTAAQRLYAKLSPLHQAIVDALPADGSETTRAAIGGVEGAGEVA